MAYASRTKVPVRQTKGEIETLVGRYGAEAFAIMTDAGMAQVAFRMNDRNILFRIHAVDTLTDQQVRSRWRALLLCIKAKLEAAEAGIETFDQAFFAHIVTRTGRTVYDEVQPRLADQRAGRDVPLLP
jgi:hypothetical protein